MGDLSNSEHRHRLAFAERQFEHVRLRAVQAQLNAQLSMLKGDVAGAERWLMSARNLLDFINECNETIDRLRRELIEAPL